MDEAGRPYDDIDFINQLIVQATANSILLGTEIDPNQIYLVGESRGAGFAYYLYADPRTRNKVKAIVPLSGTFYCDGDVANGAPIPNSDTTCGEVSQYGYWTPKPSLFTAPGVTRPTHILDVHGQLAPNGAEDPYTAPPALDVDFGSSTWAGWGDAAGCYTVQVSSQTQQTLPNLIGGKTVMCQMDSSQTPGAISAPLAAIPATRRVHLNYQWRQPHPLPVPPRRPTRYRLPHLHLHPHQHPLPRPLRHRQRRRHSS